MTTEAKPKAGLEDVVAASSAICYLDGDRGVLAYFGHDIHDLARAVSFEETCYLLWYGRLPNRAELGDLQSQLAAARQLTEPILRLMKQLPSSDGMDVLRTLTSALGPVAVRRLQITGRRFGSPPSSAASWRHTAACRREVDPSSRIRRWGMLRISSTCSPATGRTRCRFMPSTSRWCCTQTMN